MLIESGLPGEMWAEAVVTVNYIQNRTPVSAHGKTEWEAFYGKKPKVYRHALPLSGLHPVPCKQLPRQLLLRQLQSPCFPVPSHLHPKEVRLLPQIANIEHRPEQLLQCRYFLPVQPCDQDIIDPHKHVSRMSSRFLYKERRIGLRCTESNSLKLRLERVCHALGACLNPYTVFLRWQTIPGPPSLYPCACCM
jgi:hypothetical protein